MTHRMVSVLFAVLMTAPLARADDLLVSAAASLYHVDIDTGDVQHLTTLPSIVHGMAICPSGRILVGVDKKVQVLDPVTWEMEELVTLPGGVRGVACGPDGTAYAISNGGNLPPFPNDSIYRFDAETDADLFAVTLTQEDSLQSLTVSPDGLLYTWDIGEHLFTVHPTTALVTHIGEHDGPFVSDVQWMDFAPGGGLFGGRQSVVEIDLTTVEMSLVTELGLDVRAGAFLKEAPECFQVIGEAPGGSTFQLGTWGHAFETQVGGLQAWHPVLMEDVPEFVIEDLLRAGAAGARMGAAGGGAGASGGPGSGGPVSGASLDDGPAKGHAEPTALAPVEFAVQVLMWNPQVFPSLPEQYTHGLAVRISPSGRVVTVPYGSNAGGMTIWAEVDVDAAGRRVIRFPFDIPLM